MPDDMLEDTIAIAKQTLDAHDFETQGVEVNTNHYLLAYLSIDSEKSQKVHGRQVGALLARVLGQEFRVSRRA
jgi:hypothetical protein